MSDQRKTCTACSLPKPLDQFYRRTGPNGKSYPRTRCKKCDNKRRHQGENPVSAQRWRKHTAKKRSNERGRGINRSKYILWDSRKEDRRNGRSNDLTRGFIEDAISRGCTYCGAGLREIQITLDRIDNVKGHTKDNVLPACMNCNMTRKNMPFSAWLLVAPALREARRQGLLEGWTRRA